MINESTINKPRIENKIRSFIVCFPFDNWIPDDDTFSLIRLFIVVVVVGGEEGREVIPYKQSWLQLIFSIESGIWKWFEDTSSLNLSSSHFW